MELYRAENRSPRGLEPEPAPHHLATEQLLAAMEGLSAQQPVTLRVLRMLDDPTSSADKIASALVGDASLAARVLRVANSAYYGLSGRVRSLPFAVTVIGFDSVRAMAAAAAVGADGRQRTTPAGFWQRAAATGVAASLVARPLGARPMEALCVGLLHDLGQVLLHSCDPEGYAAMLAEHVLPSSLCQAERARYGLSHDRAAERVLTAWQFPTELTEAIAGHHDPGLAGRPPLARALLLGRQLAAEAIDGALPPDALPYDRLSNGRLWPSTVGNLIAQVRSEAGLLAQALAA